ncbi:MAG: TRAP transporter small permease subunit [Rhodobacter sp.]|nr:TRAP transporter small permease subunit [Paracoccaceae bacterium]MCB1409581.1 TRAP transporter small permease subunit [Paracoccaceae bacterium]MCC0078411.1 TRAP transporter small permease subunit [Rhodobacter sp.]
MARLAPLVGWLQRRAENFIALLLLGMFLTFLFQITFRYVLALPVSWTNWTVEFVSIAWLWGILFGYAFVVRDSDIIRLDIVYNALPVGWRRVFDVMTGLTVAAILLWTLPKCWDYVEFMYRERTPALRIRFNYVFAIYMAFAGAVILRSLMNVVGAITGKGGRYITPTHPEGHDYD